MASDKCQKAIDLSHHLSDLAKARDTSPLKGLAKYATKPGLISLAGGLPSAAYFPFESIGGEVLGFDAYSLTTTEESSVSWFWKLFGHSTKTKTTPLTIQKYAENAGDLNLATTLQYGTATGLPQLQTFLQEFVDKVYKPAYSDCSTLAHIGNTDGWSRVLQTLMNPGEAFLTEEWTYPSAVASSSPYGIHPIPVEMDKDGMSPIALRKILSEWDVALRGCRRPHVIYSVPVGQNPCGSTANVHRKKEIYDVCVEFDIILVEDDPYFFLQMGEYIPKANRAQSIEALSDSDWVASLIPSYLRFDYQGRVIRLDTFSKYIAPGSRLGWHTCNPMFAERLERHGETSAQAPCGFSQSLVTQLLQHWKHDGYIRWLHGLAVQYQLRRDHIIDYFGEEFHLQPAATNVVAWQGLTVYDAYPKSGKELAVSEKGGLGVRMFSFVPPSAGMFIWMKLHFDNRPAYQARGEDGESLEMQLWAKLVEAGVMVAPGWFFAANVDHPPTAETEGHFRISFSNFELEVLKKAVRIFAKVTKEFFQA